jgi:flagellar M-ring protein FliF
VPADKLAEARMKTASQGAGHSGRMGFELFDKMSWGQTEFRSKGHLSARTGRRAGKDDRDAQRRGERARASGNGEGLSLCRQGAPAKASVILKLRGRIASQGRGALAISRLVSGAVNNLKPEDVSIIDADSARSLGVGHDGQADANGIEESSDAAPDQHAGAGGGRGTRFAPASPSITTQESTEESQEKYDPTVSAVLSDQKSEETRPMVARSLRALREPPAIRHRPLRPRRPKRRKHKARRRVRRSHRRLSRRSTA